MSKRAAIFIADGSEAIEVIATADTLSRGGVKVDLVSAMRDRDVALTQGLFTKAKMLDSEFDPNIYDVVVVPGGSTGVENLSKNAPLADALCKFMEEGKCVASICAGPTILASLGLLEGRKATCYPGCQTEFPEDVYQDVIGVLTDYNLITASGPAQAVEFGLAILRVLLGVEAAENVASGMLVQTNASQSSVS